MNNFDAQIDSDIQVDSQFPRIDAGLELTKRPDVKPGAWCWEGDILRCIGGEHGAIHYMKATSLMDSALKESFKREIISFAETADYAQASLFSAFGGLATALNKHPTSTFDSTWISKAIEVPSFNKRKDACLAFFKNWWAKDNSVISEQALYLLNKTKTKQGGRNVLSDDPKKSWHTEEEFDALRRAIWNAYDEENSCTQVTLIKLLSMTYARRPKQIAHLKIGDIRTSGTAGNIPHVYFPGVKDRNAEENFRDSKFEEHPLSDDFYGLFQIQFQGVRSLFEEKLNRKISQAELTMLPVFCTAYQIDQALQTIQGHYGLPVDENLAHQAFHLKAGIISRIVKWAQNGPRLNSTSKGGFTDYSIVAKPISHRTGAPMVTNATRMRHTLARRLARRGVPKHILSAWMGHASGISLDSYYNDPAEEARKLDETMKTGLVPLAMAFAGKLLDSPKDATRGDDPDSVLEFAKDGKRKHVGNCGKFSFCTTMTVPLPCYRCKSFEPLVDAPHQEVLDALLARQVMESEIIKIGGQRNLLMPIDLSEDIRAVQNCIARCEARKKERGRK